MTTKAILCHIKDKDKLLLQLKARGKFGEGRWNGPGGKIKKGESKEQAVKREVLEETGLKVRNLKYCGKTTFYFPPEKNSDIWIVYIYLTKSFSGKIKHSKEGELRWFKAAELPYDKMWSDDKYWMPLMLKGKRFDAEFWFDKEGKKILKHKVKIC